MNVQVKNSTSNIQQPETTPSNHVVVVVLCLAQPARSPWSEPPTTTPTTVGTWWTNVARRRGDGLPVLRGGSGRDGPVQRRCADHWAPVESGPVGSSVGPVEVERKGSKKAWQMESSGP